jgi:1-acyl-sn-glycerol-3-phosphate acyltransferase
VNLRAARRAVALGVALAAAVVRYWILRARGPLTMEQRAVWLQSMAHGVLNALVIHCRVYGEPPVRGLVVANHLSYLDAAIFSAAVPCFFVAKFEIGSWPFFGKAAHVSGSIFVDRSSRAGAVAAAHQMRDRLASHIPIVLFPEGTSTDGSQVLRFHSTLFEPAVAVGAPVTAAAVRYVFEDGRPERDLCWFGDDGFLPHIWRALGAKGFFAEVRFGEPHVYPDRRSAAKSTHEEISALREFHAPVGMMIVEHCSTDTRHKEGVPPPKAVPTPQPQEHL